LRIKFTLIFGVGLSKADEGEVFKFVGLTDSFLFGKDGVTDLISVGLEDKSLDLMYDAAGGDIEMLVSMEPDDESLGLSLTCFHSVGLESRFGGKAVTGTFAPAPNLGVSGLEVKVFLVPVAIVFTMGEVDKVDGECASRDSYDFLFRGMTKGDEASTTLIFSFAGAVFGATEFFELSLLGDVV
jgi:hypothetical protein